MTFLFAITIFLSAALLFLVQPMVAKMLLPSLGGTPNVWITCMLFFQVGLLVGYGYAHLGSRWLGARLHAYVHLVLLGLAFLFLPIGLFLQATGGDDPTFELLVSLGMAVGLPYVMVSSTGPLLQKWFAMDQSKDPYFLYAASNLGSFAGLLSYPLLVEPAYTLGNQAVYWMWTYVALVILILLCSLPILIRATELNQTTLSSGQRPTLWTRLHWMFLALVPSSLMLSVTTYLTTDIASVPLLWVLPIAFYLLSFVLVFARFQLIPHWLMARALPAVVVVLTLVLLSEATKPPEILISVHLIGLFLLCMFCHGELSRTRPAAEHLTEFYLWLAVGGAVGGCFNAIVAPLVFSGVAEYPIMLVAACWLRHAAPRDSVLSTGHSGLGNSDAGRNLQRNDVLLPVAVGILTVGLILVGQSLSLEPGPLSNAVMFALPCLAAYTLLDRPLRFGLAVSAVFVSATIYEGVHGRLEQRVRSFFGVHRVTQDRTGQFRLLVHGNTVHGQQSLSPSEQDRRRPLAYYHDRSPIGRLLQELRGDDRLNRIALVGLGAGALASYAEPRQRWTFFEIDPAVEKLARQHFTYLSDSRGDVDVVIGDARLRLQKQPDHSFGLIVIDAFSSDSIPIHLLTREAVALYRQKLTVDGVLAFHISNRYLDLQPVLAVLAKDANPPMTALYQRGFVTPDMVLEGRLESEWMVLASRETDVARLLAGRRWERAKGETAVWTDDYSNLLSVLRPRSAE